MVFVAWVVPVEDDDDGWSPGASPGPGPSPGPCAGPGPDASPGAGLSPGACDIDIGTPTTAVGGLFCPVGTTIRGGA